MNEKPLKLKDLRQNLAPYLYLWPKSPLTSSPVWREDPESRMLVRDMPEEDAAVAADDQWPALFPFPSSLVTTTDGERTGLEINVGASIVNRFPYVISLSLCKQNLSERYQNTRTFMEILERGGAVSIQLLPPGAELDRALQVIQSTPETETSNRIAQTGLAVRQAKTNPSAVFQAAYLVFEARLVKPGKDFSGHPIYPQPWVDAGSHRTYLLEINAIQLRQDIAIGKNQILWRNSPGWHPNLEWEQTVFPGNDAIMKKLAYNKIYTPDYVFPSANTIAFESDAVEDGMAIKYLAPLPEDQVEVDNDRARWPSFFPSPMGLITTWVADGVPNLMPCGSTTIISRHPMIVVCCVASSAINERYTARATLEVIRRTKRFGCGIPFVHNAITTAIKYTGNVSHGLDPEKVKNSGLVVMSNEWSPILRALPVHFDCEVIDETPLGTHSMFMGEVRKIWARPDVTPEDPLEWSPWADLAF